MFIHVRFQFGGVVTLFIAQVALVRLVTLKEKLFKLIINHIINYCYLPVCSLLCTVNWDECLNSAEHNLQTNFSPVCFFMCTFKCEDCVNVLLHTLHTNGRSP